MGQCSVAGSDIVLKVSLYNVYRQQQRVHTFFTGPVQFSMDTLLHVYLDRENENFERFACRCQSRVLKIQLQIFSCCINFSNQTFPLIFLGKFHITHWTPSEIPLNV